MKMLRYLVVVIIYSQLLRCQFFTSQNKIKQNYKGIIIMKMLYHSVVFLEIVFGLVNIVEPKFIISYLVFMG